MAKAVLPVNFKDDVLDSSMGGERRYVLVQHSDGTYSLRDATVYTQAGSAFGQAQINATNKAVNESVDKAVIIDNINDIMANTTSKKVAGALALKQVYRDLGGLSFGKTAEGEWGYKPSGADTVTPFNNLKTIAQNAAIMSAKGGGNYTTSQTHSGLVIGKPYFIITAEGGGSFAPQSITGMTIINQFFHDVAGAAVSPPCLTIGIATATSITINYTYHNGGVVSVVIG